VHRISVAVQEGDARTTDAASNSLVDALLCGTSVEMGEDRPVGGQPFVDSDNSFRKR
jgi:hypothetical protein